MLAAQHRLLSMAVAVSLLFHLVLLSLHFAPPDSTRLKPLEAGLDIILVNASDDKVPLKAEALAQANLDGGGNADAGRATSIRAGVFRKVFVIRSISVAMVAE